MIPSDSHSWRCSGSFAFISVRTCTRVYSYQGCTRAPETKSNVVSLKSDPAFYRVELLIADNPAAPPTLCLGLTPSFSLLPSCPPLLFSVFTSPPFSSLVLSLSFCSHCLFPHLPLHSLRSSQEGSYSAAVSLRFAALVCRAMLCCVGRYCRWCGAEPGGASKADYVLILAKEAGNSFKPTKPFH